MLENKQHAFRFFGLLAGVLLIISMIGTALVPLFAQDDGPPGNGLRITPVRQELTLEPGQNESYSIEVTNVTTSRTTVNAVVNDFESDDETGQPRLLVNTDEPAPFSVKEFIDLPGEFELAAGESQSVSISVRIPGDALPGGYFGAIRFEAGAGSGSGDGTVALSASVASLLLVSVPGEAEEGMSLDYIEARRGDNGGKFFEYAPDTIAVRLENDGNTILKPIGRVAIKNMFGNEVYSYEFNGGQVRGNILPKSGRIFENSTENIGPLGRYTIEANLSYGDGGGNIITATSSFWVVPWKLLLVAAAVIAFIVWFATRGIKIYNRRIVERSKRG